MVISPDTMAFPFSPKMSDAVYFPSSSLNIENPIRVEREMEEPVTEEMKARRAWILSSSTPLIRREREMKSFVFCLSEAEGEGESTWASL